MKKIKYLIISAAVSALVFLSVMATAKSPGPGNMNRAVIKIDRISCGGCFLGIRQSLSSLEGYSGLGTNIFRRLIAVDFTDPLTIDGISGKLAEAGYPGTVQSVEPVPEKESFAYLESGRAGAAGNDAGCCSRGYADTQGSQAPLPDSCCLTRSTIRAGEAF